VAPHVVNVDKEALVVGFVLVSDDFVVVMKAVEAEVEDSEVAELEELVLEPFIEKDDEVEDVVEWKSC
jgi:hypothetical protein